MKKLVLLLLTLCAPAFAEQCQITSPLPVPVSLTGCTYSGSLPNNSTSYIQNTLSPTTTSQLFSVQDATVTESFVATLATIPVISGSTITYSSATFTGLFGSTVSYSSATFRGITGSIITYSSATFPNILVGGYYSPGVLKSISYNATAADNLILASGTLAGITVTLPLTTSSNGQNITISKVDKTSGTVKIQASGTDLIAGTGTITLNAFMQTAAVISDGNGNWIPYGQGIQYTPNWVGPGTFGTSANTVGTSSIAVCNSFYTTVPVYIDTVTLHVATASTLSETDIGIYDDLGNRLSSNGGSYGPTSLGRDNIALNPPLSLPAGKYWMCMTNGGTAANFTSASAVTNQYPESISCSGANDPLPSTLAFPCNTTNRTVMFNMWGHVAGGSY